MTGTAGIERRGRIGWAGHTFRTLRRNREAAYLSEGNYGARRCFLTGLEKLQPATLVSRYTVSVILQRGNYNRYIAPFGQHKMLVGLPRGFLRNERQLLISALYLEEPVRPWTVGAVRFQPRRRGKAPKETGGAPAYPDTLIKGGGDRRAGERAQS